MTAEDFPSALLGAFWPGVLLPAALLGLCLVGGLTVTRGRRTKEATKQILGAFFAVAGLYFADGQTALPLAVFVLALLGGLLAGFERAPGRVRPRSRRVGRPHAQRSPE